MSIPAAHASPWGQPPQDLLSINRVEIYQTSNPGGRFDQYTLQGYVEYGLSRHWTVGGKITQAWQDIQFQDTLDQRSGLVEGEVFAQRALLAHNAHRIAVSALYAIPANIQSALQGQVDSAPDAALQLSALYGYSTGTAFFATQTGYRSSLGSDADQWRTEITVGYRNDRGALFLLDLNTTIAITEPGLDGVDFNVASLRPSVVWPLTDRIRVQVGAHADVWGRNIDRGTGGFVSLWVSS